MLLETFEILAPCRGTHALRPLKAEAFFEEALVLGGARVIYAVGLSGERVQALCHRFDEQALHPNYRYFLDTKSLTFGEDGVVRYTAVIESRSGARNVIYEGIRCRTDEVKLYAYAAGNGAFREPRISEWQPLKREGIKGYQLWLSEQIICGPDGLGLRPERIKRILAGLERGGGLFRSPGRGQ